ncbi:MAG: hypothetical protein H7A35_01820 [Planctomycetales bacterium]|nr:hypothetical protein [bacterium]UNM08796.1 MAG: hypothetical protein H7A35_01820 [Planctomycetales bacterium]
MDKHLVEEAGQAGQEYQPSSFMPRDLSHTIITAIVILAALAAVEVKWRFLSGGMIDYSLWPDDFLAACGELSRVRMSSGRSALATSASIAGLGMLALMGCEYYWDQLRKAWHGSALPGYLPAGQSYLLEPLDNSFRLAMAVLAGVLVAVDCIALAGWAPLQPLQPLALTRFVAIWLLLLRIWLPGELRSALDSQPSRTANME